LQTAAHIMRLWLLLLALIGLALGGAQQARSQEDVSCWALLSRSQYPFW
jgi:hypothetical protein